MKKFTILETTILGFFVGVVISSYVAFVSNTGGFIGVTLHWISLRPLFDLISIPENQILVASFIFSVSVYTMYGALIGLIAKKLSRPNLVVLPIVCILFGLAVYEQTKNLGTVTVIDDVFAQPASVIHAQPKVQKQYFGNEARGDLNADGKDDIAFFIHRDDNARGMLYYLTTALATETGNIGTNLIFLGDGIEPQTLNIENGIISIGYVTTESESIQTMLAKVENGTLEKLEAPAEETM